MNLEEVLCNISPASRISDRSFAIQVGVSLPFPQWNKETEHAIDDIIPSGKKQ